MRDDKNARKIEILLPMRTTGTLPPVFFVHPGGGLSQCYVGFLAHLNRDRPVYALQSRAFTTTEIFRPTVEEMAADYLMEIRKIQPAGPYHLAGWSLGGLIAYAMATAIQQEGDRVATLALMDSIPWDPHLANEGDPPDVSLSDVARNLYGNNLPTDGWDIPTLFEYLRRSDRLPILLSEYQFTVLLNNLKLGEVMIRRFVPMKYYGDLVMFLASDHHNKVLGVERWHPYVCGAIRVHNIACSHPEMMHPQPLAQIAAILERELSHI